jgi:hypothetical protein
MPDRSAKTPKGVFDSPAFLGINKFFSTAFGSDAQSTKNRKLFFLLFFVLIWSFFALILHPLHHSIWDDFSLNPTTIIKNITAILSLYFSLDVLFHMLFFLLGAIISYQFVKQYFAAMYGIKSNNFNDHYLLKTIFGYPREEPIKIDSSQVMDKQINLLKVIGGPTKVIIGAESAAIFEKFDGKVQIVGPTMNLPRMYYQLEKFERLREIFDLRNQTIQFDLQARTKDGIPLTLKGMKVLFSILRNSKKTTLTRPYSFNAQSLYRLAYKIPSGVFSEKITEIFKQEIINNIRQHPLSALLENVGELEVQEQSNLELLEKTIKYRKKQKFVHTYLKHSFFPQIKYKNTPGKKIGRNHKKIHIFFHMDPQLNNNKKSHSSLTRSMNYSNSFIKNMTMDISVHAREYGINLEWVSLGSIECSSQKIQSQLQNAWQISSEHQQLPTQSGFKNLISISEIKEIDSLFNTLLKSENSNQNNGTDEQQDRIILSKIINNLVSCESLYDEELPEKKIQLKKTIHELNRVLNIR